MILSIQLKLLIISFVYGMLISYIIKYQYDYFFNSKIVYRIVLDTFFVFDIIAIYFIILQIISNGVFHIYFLFSILLGYLFAQKL